MAKETIQYQELLNVVRSMKRKDELLFYFFLSACENGNLQICQFCLDAGADINFREPYYKETLLIKLVKSGKFTTEVGDWLIEKGANINIPGIAGFTSLTEACCQGSFDIAKYLIDKGIKIRQYKNERELSSDLYYAVCGKNYEIVKMLLNSGVDLESTIKGDNLLIAAVNRKQPKIVELFLQKGASPDFCTCYKTPLHIAVSNKDIQTANILLKYNANVNARLKGSARFVNDDVVLTPLDIAVLNQDIDMQKLLTAFGGTVSSKEEKIQTLTECNDSNKGFLMLKKILAS